MSDDLDRDELMAPEPTDEPMVEDESEPAPEPTPGEQIRAMTRRSLLWGAAAVAGVVAGRQWLVSRPEEDGLPWPFRRVLEFNEGLSRKVLFSEDHLAPTFAQAKAVMPKENGKLGLMAELSEDWRLKLVGVHGHDEPVELTLEELRALPQVDLVTELKCVEGWSEIVWWTGARLADLIAMYPPITKGGEAPDVANQPDRLADYVSLSTPDHGYYVGLEMAAALHPQTLLCYAMGGQPLTPGHGAPLRLATPLKYGIKNIKRIGTIAFSNVRPTDYWGERGYDWYSGH